MYRTLFHSRLATRSRGAHAASSPPARVSFQQDIHNILWKSPKTQQKAPRVALTLLESILTKALLRNSPRFNTYVSKGLKVLWNQYLQKSRGGGGGIHLNSEFLNLKSLIGGS